MAGKKIYYGSLLAIFGVGLFLFICGWILQYVAFPAILKSQVKKSLVLGHTGNDLNEFASDWLYSNYTVKMEYYIFNYTNALEMLNRGMKPDAIQKGPYTYRQMNDYVYQNFSADDDTFEYNEESLYYFDKSSSCHTCDPINDVVVIPDMFFATVFGFVNQFGPMLNISSSTMSTILKLIEIPLIGYKSGPFVTVNVNEFLFKGYKSPLITMIEKLNATLNGLDDIINSNPLIGAVFSQLLGTRIQINANNGTAAFYYTIKTGKDDYKNVGEVIYYRESLSADLLNATTKFWNGYDSSNCTNPKYASEFRGTNGDYFAPFIDKDTKLSAYIDDICRSIDFVYLEESKVGEIDTYRFVIDPKAFDYSVPENCGFCSALPFDMYGKTQGDYCLPTGLLDATQCQGGGLASMAFSLPHFFQAEKVVQQFFPRAKAIPEQHQTTLDIEPTSGTVLAAQKRLQVNALIGGLPGPYNLVPSGAYPLVWVDNTYMADDDTLKTAKDSLVTPKKIVLLVSFIVGIGFGAFLMLLAVSIFIFRKLQLRSRTPSSLASTLNRQAETMESPPIYRRREDEINTSVVRRIPRARVTESEW